MSPSGNPNQYNTPSSSEAATVRGSLAIIVAKSREHVLLLTGRLLLAILNAEFCRQITSGVLKMWMVSFAITDTESPRVL